MLSFGNTPRQRAGVAPYGKGCASMNADELDFHLPAELIAQAPAIDRTASRLLHYGQTEQSIAHRTFGDLPSLLRPGDLLVFNNARVIPARFSLHKSTGGRVEGLFVGQAGPCVWQVLLKNLGPVRDDVGLHFSDDPTIGARRPRISRALRPASRRSAHGRSRRTRRHRWPPARSTRISKSNSSGRK